MADAEPRIVAALLRRFPNNDVAPKHFGELLVEYLESGLSPPHLIAEIETADEGKLWSCIWEAMLYRHLRSEGYRLRGSATRSRQFGPDFGVESDGRVIWIEATVPSPSGIDPDYLKPSRSGEMRSRPDVERVLRCASVIRDKQKKLAEYRQSNLIGPDDCAVIAVNICRLSDHDIDGSGISQFPLVMEALFPIGPIAEPILQDGTMGDAQNMPRYLLKKTSGVDVPTGFFFDPDFANVSAVVQGHQKDMVEKPLILVE